MMADQKASKKTKRAQRTQKKGAVRQHNPKPVDKMANTGLLDHLHMSSTRDPEDNLTKAVATLYTEFGTRVTALVKDEDWQLAVRPLVRDYIKSLMEGDGTKPKELSSICAERINLIFVELCSKRIVGDDILPGQRQDWYQPTLAKYREERLQATRKPSPLSMPKRRELQAAS